MKLGVDLQPIFFKGTGIGTFTHELIMQLQNQPSADMMGFYSSIKKRNFEEYTFPTRNSILLERLINKSKFSTPLPIPYRWIAGRRNDINLFFGWRMHRLKKDSLIVVTIHDLIILHTEMGNQDLVDSQLNELRYVCKHSDYILTVSEASKADIVKDLGYPEDRIEIIPNGVHFEEFHKEFSPEQIKAVRVKYDLPPHFVLYFGAIRKHKNIENLIKAYAVLPIKLRQKFKLVITRESENLKSLARELKVEQDVFFTKFIDSQDKPIIYQMATLSMFISFYEGFGIPILEAQAAGTPVITSNVSSMPEVAGNGAILVNPYNIDVIARSIQAVLESPLLQKELILKGVNNAKKYSWENAGKKLFKFLNKISNT